ncbi:hypothetical protein DPMN_165261 [Dreissena polymorpha]|uniref:Endonuclease/exonuclease/phosphatase domain-containing protein n=1 Tax=Dreissena polymorpha TaxID=45954 RepID=A0A9D4EWI1_DREPO|nr:hypothetical protein DPMN_165261 [Dreissena polymorpha]
MKMEGKKDLIESSFYMPHRKMSDIQERRKSLELATLNHNRQMVVAGDFNCPDIDWENLAVRNSAQDKTCPTSSP